MKNDRPPTKPKWYQRRFQFSIWALLVLMTAVCIIFAVPGAPILFASVAFWGLVGAAIVLLLVAIQIPGYYLLQRIRSVNSDESYASHDDGAASSVDRE